MEPPPPEPAGRRRRLFAGILDWPIAGITAPFQRTGRYGGVRARHPVEHAFFAGLTAFPSSWLRRWSDAGKETLRHPCRAGVRRQDGRKAGRRPSAQAVERVLIRLCCAGALLDLGRILFDPRKQALHDKAARTVVVIA